MGRTPSCSKDGLNRGAWTETEDRILQDYVRAHGEGKWSTVPKKAGLNRCGKSCRLRWLNYLRPDIKRGNISEDEEELIMRMHNLLGNRWALIAGRLPGRTDNEIKNYWNTIAGKKVQGRHPPVSTPSSRGASSSPSKQNRIPSTRPSTDQQPKPDPQPRDAIKNQEPDGGKERLEFQPEVAARPPWKDPSGGDLELDDHFLSKFFGLDEDNKEEDNGYSGLGAAGNEKISQASSSLNSEDALMSLELMLCESDLRSIASFLEEGELELPPQY